MTTKVSLAVGAAVVLGMAQPAAATLPADYKSRADALLAESYPADGPGASVVVTEHGKIVYQASRGLADVEAQRPITPATVFRMGSITKQFAAAVVLQLAAEGKVKLTDPISTYFPGFPGGSGITVAQLLNHTSGIQSYTSIPGWMNEDNVAKAYTTEQMIAVFKDLPPVSKPGEQWAYNNSGYVLVGALIEAVTKRPWAEEVDRRIVRPLGLSTIRYGIDEAKVAGMAKGYSRDDDKVVPARRIHMTVPSAAGALIGTPADLARWGAALHHGKVVTQPLYARMITPTTLPDGHVQQYGFGLETGDVRGEPSIGHSGGIFGFSTDSAYLPKEDLFIAVFANSDAPQTAPGTTMRRLAALAIGKPYPQFKAAAIDAKAVEPMLGVYKFGDVERTVRMIDGKLYSQRTGRPPQEIFAAGNDRYFFGNDALDWFEWRRDAAGKRVVAFHPAGAEEAQLGEWMGPVRVARAAIDVPAATLASYTGQYRSPFGPIAIDRGGDGPLTIQLKGQSALPMKPVAAGEFEVEQVSATVRFASEGGKVTGMEIDQGGRKIAATRN